MSMSQTDHMIGSGRTGGDIPGPRRVEPFFASPAERYVPKDSEAIEAVQWRFEQSPTFRERTATWCGGRIERVSKASDHTDVATILHMPTLEGVVRVHHGDWVIREANGRFRKMTNEAFVKQYERRG